MCHVDFNAPVQTVKISGGTLTSFYVPYYGGDVIVKMKSKEDVDGLIYVMASYY